MTRDEIDRTVGEVVLLVARQRRPELASAAPADRLRDDLGLDSLDLAQLVATLEQELGVDPFAAGATVGQVATVADLCALYARAVAPGA